MYPFSDVDPFYFYCLNRNSVTSLAYFDDCSLSSLGLFSLSVVAFSGYKAPLSTQKLPTYQKSVKLISESVL